MNFDPRHKSGRLGSATVVECRGPSDLLGEVVVDLSVPWNARCSIGGADEDGMVAPLSEQPATVLLQVVDQRAALHGLTLSGSRMTGPEPVVA